MSLVLFKELILLLLSFDVPRPYTEGFEKRKEGKILFFQNSWRKEESKKDPRQSYTNQVREWQF